MDAVLDRIFEDLKILLSKELPQYTIKVSQIKNLFYVFVRKPRGKSLGRKGGKKLQKLIWTFAFRKSTSLKPTQGLRCPYNRFVLEVKLQMLISEGTYVSYLLVFRITGQSLMLKIEQRGCFFKTKKTYILQKSLISMIVSLKEGAIILALQAYENVENSYPQVWCFP